MCLHFRSIFFANLVKPSLSGERTLYFKSRGFYLFIRPHASQSPNYECRFLSRVEGRGYDIEGRGSKVNFKKVNIKKINIK